MRWSWYWCIGVFRHLTNTTCVKISMIMYMFKVRNFPGGKETQTSTTTAKLMPKLISARRHSGPSPSINSQSWYPPESTLTQASTAQLNSCQSWYPPDSTVAQASTVKVDIRQKAHSPRHQRHSWIPAKVDIRQTAQWPKHQQSKLISARKHTHPGINGTLATANTANHDITKRTVGVYGSFYKYMQWRHAGIKNTTCRSSVFDTWHQGIMSCLCYRYCQEIIVFFSVGHNRYILMIEWIERIALNNPNDQISFDLSSINDRMRSCALILNFVSIPITIE
jgi:hypothetical protein